MNRRFPLWAAIALICIQSVFATPIRVSFLDTDAAREDTLKILADAGCDPANLDAIRKAILHYYQTPLALDTASFPPATNGFYDFASVGDFISALGTHSLAYLYHPFELNCANVAVLLTEREMNMTADLQSRHGQYLAIQATNGMSFTVPADSLGDVYAITHPAEYESSISQIIQTEFSDKFKTHLAALYQGHFMYVASTADNYAANIQSSLRRHWTQCGVQFPHQISPVMLHRAHSDFSGYITDHMGVLVKQAGGYLYLEKTGGQGPFLRIDIQDPAEIAAYYATMTYPGSPFNYMTVNDELFLQVPLRQTPPPSAPTAPVPGPPTAVRAKQAIQQRYNEISAEKLDGHGYAASAELNLLPGVRLEDIQGDFAQGSGNELAGKFRAAHSSSALAANTFGPWRKNPETLSLLGHTGFTSLQFERQCPTGLGGIPPNLDLVLVGTDVVIGIESKFLETLTPKQPKFTDSYKPERLPQMEECWAELMASLKAGPEQYLDGAQLVRHYLGLRNQPEFKGKKIILLNIFWEPENWLDFPEFRQHRAELAAFQKLVKDSEVTFVWMTYPELWRYWEAQGHYPDHVRDLQKRYGLSI